MNIAHVAFHANSVLEHHGLGTETVAFWDSYLFSSQLTTITINSHAFIGRKLSRWQMGEDFSCELYITREDGYVIHFNPDDRELEPIVIVADSQEDVLKFLSDFEDALLEVDS